jgi:uncharacterized protein (TIGR02284 family)
LNELIEASKDGERDFALAAKETRAPELTGFFNEREQDHRAAAAELQDQVRLLGDMKEQDGSMKAAARRGWTRIRSALSFRGNMAILDECERGEDYIRACYTEALELEWPRPVDAIVERQFRSIVESHYRVMDLRNRFRDSGPRALRSND